MMKKLYTWIKGKLAWLLMGGTVFAAVAVPTVPYELEFVKAYQIPYERQTEGYMTPDVLATSTGVITKGTFVSRGEPVFEDEDENGIVSVAVFKDKGGDLVYQKITDETYAAMGGEGGYAYNPKKTSKESLAGSFATKEAEAAIAIDASTNGNNPTRGASSETFAHTNAGDIILIAVQRNDDTTTAADDVTGVTYNGAALTQYTKLNTSTIEPGVLYIYGLTGPATGSNNVVVSLTGSTGSRAYTFSASYSGAKQTSQPDAVNTKYETEVNSQSVSVTTVADNSWLFLLGSVSSGGGTHTAGTDTTQRQVRSPGAIYDSNSAKTPAGAYALAWSYSSTVNLASVMVSFAPSVAGDATFAPWQMDSF